VSVVTINRIHKTGHFVQIPNATLRDERLSFKARGVLAYILSHVDGWRADANDIADASTDGRTAVLSALKELEDKGYRKVARRQDDKGRWVTDVHWFETPAEGIPEDVQTEVGFSDSGSPDRIRTPSQNTMKNSRSSSSSSLRSSDDSSLTGWTICRECGDTMWNGRCWRMHSSEIQKNGDAHDTGE
jgi:hypothetical protein